MKRSVLSLYIVTAAIFLAAPEGLAQESLIELISKFSASIVTVSAHIPKNTGEGSPESANQGAGVIIDASGIIVTNLHTIKFSDKIIIELHDNTQLPAKIIELWPAQDLALLSVTPTSPLTAITIADSDQVQLGDEIVNIGTSLYRKDSLAGGRITALGRSSSTNALEIIRVNLDLYEGDSGGALFNRQGQLIGMLIAKDTTQERNAFALPSNKIKNLYLKAKK